MERTLYPERGDMYSHYKGGKYKVLTMATHSETGEAMVVYQSLIFGSIFVRPLSLWNSWVEEVGVPSIKRFIKI